MKLLIAEDDRDLRYALEIFFQRNRFNVDCVDNGEDALSYLSLEEYDGATASAPAPRGQSKFPLESESGAEEKRFLKIQVAFYGLTWYNSVRKR